MTWVAILIMLTGLESHNSIKVGEGKTMNECFDVRDQLLIQIGAVDGIPPNGVQIVCIPIESA